MTERHVVFEQVNELISRIKHGSQWIMLWTAGDIAPATVGELRTAHVRAVRRLWTTGGRTGEDRDPRPTSADTRVVHNPQALLLQLAKNSLRSRRGGRVKFRCERDTLADAVATAQRTVASRSGALPVLQDLRITADRATASSSSAPTSRSRTGCRSRPRSRRRASRSCPKLFGEIVRKLEPGPVTVDGHRRRSGDHGRPVRDVVATEAGRGLSRGSRPSRGRRACAVDAGGVRGGAAPGRAGPRPRTTSARSSPACCSPRTRGGLRLVATDSYRLAVRDLKGVSMLAGGPEGARRGQGPGRGAAPAPATGEIEVVLRRARRRVPHVARRGHRRGSSRASSRTTSSSSRAATRTG